MERTEGSVQERKRVLILNGELIETPIVNAWVQGTMLLDKEKSCTDWKK